MTPRVLALDAACGLAAAVAAWAAALPRVRPALVEVGLPRWGAAMLVRLGADGAVSWAVRPGRGPWTAADLAAARWHDDYRTVRA